MAATIHVHVGQCGNQLGESFWALAAAKNSGGGNGAGDDEEASGTGPHNDGRCGVRCRYVSGCE